MPGLHLSSRQSSRWLGRTVLGIGLASFLSDFSHEIATVVLPAFLASLGAAAPAWLGLIEGIADGLSGTAKLAAGYWTDRWRRRKPVAVLGYLVTTAGTGLMALAATPLQVLFLRAGAWLGRGVRTPVRKTLLAAAVDKESYGRAFGFERMMDTLGAIAGPATAMLLLGWLVADYRSIFLFTLLPGTAAALAFAALVQEARARPASLFSLGQHLLGLPRPFSRFLLAVGLFGAGDFSHTLLILLAVERLLPGSGAARAAALAGALYLVHNILYAAFAWISGWLADRFDKRLLLVTGYALGTLMALLLLFPFDSPLLLFPVFALGGIYVGMEETLEDSLAAELVSPERHGLAFGLLSSVNAAGDLVSSLVVGLLWSRAGTGPAFALSAFILGAGTVLLAATALPSRSIKD